MSDLLKRLELSTEIVKGLGNSLLPNGKTLTEQFTFDGLSMWEVIEPVMALYYVPEALSTQDPPNFSERIRPHLSLVKQKIINLKKRLLNRPCCDLEVDPHSGGFLFMGFSGYMYRDVLKPVVDYLSSIKRCESMVLHDELHLQNIPISIDFVQSSSIWDFWDTEVAIEALKLNRQLKNAIIELQDMKILPQLVPADVEEHWPQLQNAFNWLFNFHFPLLVPQVVIARYILKRHRPAIIISADVADSRARIYSLVGRQLNIPSFEIQFGPSGAEGVEWQFLLADRVATWGEVTQEALLKHGVKEWQISVTGSPRHDSLVNIKPNEVTKTRSRLGVPPGHILVLCASTYQQKEYNSFSNPDLLTSMKSAVFKSAGLVEGIYLVVKPHPLEKVLETKQLIGSGKNIMFLDPVEDIRELIKACDVFLGFGSTSTVDAMIANKLIICPAFSNWIWSDMYLKSDAVLIPRSAEEILSSFCRIVSESIDDQKATLEPARLKFLQKWAYKIDGHSSERVVAAIEITLENK